MPDDRDVDIPDDRNVDMPMVEMLICLMIEMLLSPWFGLWHEVFSLASFVLTKKFCCFC